VLEPDSALWVWRHPRPVGAAGRCIGRTDLAVDRRRAKRLAHRIRQAARRHGLPRRVLTSPLQRCSAVGDWLRRWGWRHERLPALREMDFGDWDGLAWAQIKRDEVDSWCAGFLYHRPGGGENLHGLFDRVSAWRPPPGPVAIVSHGGWMLARRWAASGAPAPAHPAQWRAAPRYGECWHLDAMASGRPLTIAGAAA
jgi:alpha-ribazole phosphatase